MMNNILFSSNKDSWATPQSFFDELDAEFHFTIDVCADETNHKCPVYFTKEQDGLLQDWGGHTVFCNPPYGAKATGDWTRKCWEEAQKPNTTVVLLIPARTDRKSFHEYIYKKNKRGDSLYQRTAEIRRRKRTCAVSVDGCYI